MGWIDEELGVSTRPVGMLVIVVNVLFNYLLIIMGLSAAAVSFVLGKFRGAQLDEFYDDGYEPTFSYPNVGCDRTKRVFQEALDGPVKRAISQRMVRRADSLAAKVLRESGGALGRQWTDIDVACGGGGFRGQYTGGVLSVIQALEKRGALIVHRYSGASIGAAAAASFATSGVDFLQYVRAVYGWQALYTGHFWRGYPIFRAMLDSVLPDDAHVKARGKVFVSVTTLTPWPCNVLVSDFRDREARTHSRPKFYPCPQFQS